MKKNIIFNFIFYKKFSKNFLIFLPMIFSYNLNIENFIICFFGFLIFSFIVNICYLTNNYLDFEIDKKNILKKNLFKLSKKTILLFNVILILFLVVLFLNNYFSYFLILYLMLFFSYTFFFKKFFLLDILCLSFFYVLRIYYGGDLINSNITIGFVIFFLFIFIILAIYKRIIQINTNNLNNNNKIIPYNISNISLLKNISDLFLFLTLILLGAYLFLEKTLNVKIFKFSFSGSNYEAIFILSLFFFNFFRIRNLVISKKIKNDIVDFIVTDIISILSSAIMTILVIKIYL
jgi:4-hydroxybenzoate polyprenyltransferase